MKKHILRTLTAALLISTFTALPAYAQTTGKVSVETLFVRSGAGTDSTIVDLLDYDDSVTILGQSDSGWYQISWGGGSAYVCSDYVSGISETAGNTESASAPAQENASQASAPEQEPAQTEAEAPAPAWTGPVLTRSKGVVQGPSGKETYYNLDMSGVIRIMRNMGNNDEYWVRSDGAKMLGDYIMCAANLNVHPRGSLVESSLGTCIVCDTGGFAYSNPNQLDIATTW